MISIDAGLAQPGSDSAARHIRYADALARAADGDSPHDAHITVIAKTRRAANRADSPAVSAHSPHLTAIPTHSRNTLTFIGDAIRLAQRHVTRPVDLVTAQDPFASGMAAYWIARTRRAPFLLQNFSTFYDNPAWTRESPIRNRALMLPARFLRARADFYRVSNRAEYDSYGRAGGDLARCAILPVSTVTETFAAPPDPAAIASARADLGLPDGTPLVLWVGHPVGLKRVPLLFDIFRRVLDAVPNARLALIGDLARSPDDLGQLVQDRGIAHAVILHGVVPHDQLPAYYACGAVYVHTSSYEGVPRVLQEAASVGLPLVGIAASGIDPILHDGVNGYLIPEDGAQVEHMAARIVELLRDPVTARRMGDAGRQIARTQFSAEAYTAALVALWTRAIALGRRAAPHKSRSFSSA
jgi:glycosyltransferase involved in cell wall biosynthesis